MAIITPPRVETGKAFPKAAFYPFVVGTSTEASPAQAIERWHRPHYAADLDVGLRETESRIGLCLSGGRDPILGLEVTAHTFDDAVNRYHAFTVDEVSGTPYKVNIFMGAPHSEHEAEGGSLTLHDHAMLERLDVGEVDPIPFREEWYRAGIQTFEELEHLGRS